MGYVFTTDAVKEQLKEMNRDYEGRKTWGNMYAQADLTGQLGTSQVNYDYASAMNEAYKSAYSQQSSIKNSNLGTGLKSEANLMLDDALMQAFETYRQNYLSSKSQVDASVNEIKAGIDEALTDQANNIIAYQESTYDYLTDIYNRAYGLGDYKELGADDTLNNLFTNDVLWNRYLTKDPYGNDRLKTRDELMLEMYDKDQNLTMRGAEFYDQMLNALGTQYGEEYGFNKWLQNTNEDLYNWSVSNNPYATGATDDYGRNSNLAYMRNMLGLESTDAKYDFAERYGAISRDEITKGFSSIQDKLNNLQKLADAGNTAEGYEHASEEVVEQYVGIIDEIETLAKKYGIHDEFGKQLGGWDNIKNNYEGMLEGTFKGTNWWSSQWEANDTGGFLGDVNAAIKTPLAVIGSGIAWIFGNSKSTEAVNNLSNAKQSNKERLAAIENAYADLVDTMVMMAYSKSEQAQNAWNKK